MGLTSEPTERDFAEEFKRRMLVYRGLAEALYEATEYFAAQEKDREIDWPQLLRCQDRVKNARAAYEREVGDG